MSLENKNSILPSFSTKYHYDDVEIAGYGEFEVLDLQKPVYVAKLICDGAPDAAGASVGVFVDGKKIGALPENRLQQMWHDFIQRGHPVTASVMVADGIPRLTLRYKVPSSKVHAELKASGVKSFLHEFYNCKSFDPACVEDFAEFDVEEGDELEPVISWLGEDVGSIPDYEQYGIQDAYSIRAFFRSASKNGDGTSSVITEIFLSPPVSPVRLNAHGFKKNRTYTSLNRAAGTLDVEIIDM